MTPAQPAVDVWVVDLDSETGTEQQIRAVLSPTERERADRHVLEAHRRRWARGRWALRHILGGYVGIPPASLEFDVGSEGKPRLETGAGVDFNVSHSGALFTLAVSTMPLGFDVELARPRARLDDVARKVFSGESLERFQRMVPERRLSVFYRGWTMKEAVLKCLGRGVFALGHVDLILDDDEPALASVTLPEWDRVRAGVIPVNLSIRGSWDATPVASALAYLDAPASVRIRGWSPGPDGSV